MNEFHFMFIIIRSAIKLHLSELAIKIYIRCWHIRQIKKREKKEIIIRIYIKVYYIKVVEIKLDVKTKVEVKIKRSESKKNE